MKMVNYLAEVFIKMITGFQVIEHGTSLKKMENAFQIQFMMNIRIL
jgi:hypothetical protein